MHTTSTTSPPASLEAFLLQLVTEVVGRIDYGQLKERKFAYSPAEVAELCGFSNELAVIREANAGKLLGCKLRGKWRFTEEQIRDYLREHEFTATGDPAA